MKVKEYLDKVAYIERGDDTDPSAYQFDCYLSRYDGSYIKRVGMEDDIAHLAELEITEQLTHGVGFSPLHNKWYGWSHRAICGFTIGSTCKKGDCHYVGSTEQEQMEAAIEFWSDDDKKNVRCLGVEEKDGDRYFIIAWDLKEAEETIPPAPTAATTVRHYIRQPGRGEWTAQTMEDAKQMAIDFNEGVS